MKQFMKWLWCFYRDLCPYAVSFGLFMALAYFVQRPPTIEILLWWIAFILSWIFAILVVRE